MKHRDIQRHRINRVTNFIQANLHHELDLHTLADVAYLSRYQFVRVFSEHTDQTPIRYLRRARLERAARQLVFLPGESVGKIATRCGFSSHQSFTRAFSRYFHHPPDELRAVNAKSDSNMEIVTLDNVPRHINVSVKNRPAMRIAYVRHFGAYNRERGGIYEAACLLREWAETRKLDSKLPLIGQCHDNRRITPAHFCEYDIGIPIGPDVVEDDVVSVLTLPAGRYAIGHVSCKNEQLISAWDWLCSTWREHHSEPYQQRWNYEVFHHSQDGRLRPEEGVDICLRLTN